MHISEFLGFSWIALVMVCGDVVYTENCLNHCPCSDSLSRHPGDSSQAYFMCVRGSPQRFQCQDGFKFDSSTEACVNHLISTEMITCSSLPEPCHMVEKRSIDGSGDGDGDSGCLFGTEGSGCGPNSLFSP